MDVVLANLKPNFKLESGKKGTIADYMIDEFDGTFVYDEFLRDYVLIYKSAESHPPIGIDLNLEPSKGTIEIGTTKTLKLETKDPSRELWHKCYQRWSKLENTKVQLQPPSTLLRKENDFLTATLPIDDNQAEDFKRMANELEMKEPVYMERVFRIKFKNSYRFVEPKGPHPPNETRIVYLKVKVQPPK
jgi:hypothetical protein